jgi:S-adenosylmethionine:tRNA ribosyltransferase-isomerase
MLKLSDFDYKLPQELIAQYPLGERDSCRLMILERKSRSIAHKNFKDITAYINRGDCLVANDTKVIPARLFGRRKSGGRVEIFLVEKKNPVCEALIRPSARVKEGEKIILESGDEAEIMNKAGVGRFVKFTRPVDDIIAEIGHTPLPPYISRSDAESDKTNYQTIYGVKEGATASPTAGLHFSETVLKAIEAKSTQTLFVTLHVSYGTFAPVKTEDIVNHRMHSENFELNIFAVGTTSCRVLETCAVQGAGYRVEARRGETDLFIYPPYEFKMTDALLTNFHLPKSTLLLLVSAFAGKDLIFKAYKEAIAEKYRFFSYGDCMLII